MPTPTDPQMIPKREGGTDAYGLYVDFIVYEPGTFTSNAKLVRQERYFLARHVLCKYVRAYGNKRAAWRAFPVPSHDEARKLLMRSIRQYESSAQRVEMVHRPMLVELSNTDIDAIAKGDAPYARFAGSLAADRAVGKIDDETWMPKAVL